MVRAAKGSGIDTSREEQVYEAALRLFHEKGYHATSMQDIADAVGLYKGSLYHYIGGKEDLLLRVFGRAMDELVVDMEAVSAEPTDSAADQLRRAVRAHVRAVAGNLHALTVYLHEWRALEGDKLAGVRAQRERYADIIAGIVERGVRCGEFRTADVRLTTLAILGMCNWLSQWFQPGGRLEPDQIADHFADLVLRGLDSAPPGQGTMLGERG